MLRDKWRQLWQEPGASRIRRFFEGDPLAFERRAVSPEVRARFRAEQLSDLERSTSVEMMASCIGALVFAMSMRETQRADQAGVWAVSIFILAGVIYGRRVSASRTPRRTASPNGIWRATANALLHSSLWGALPVFFFADAGLSEQFIISCLCVATLFGGGFALSMIPVALLAHIGPIAGGGLFAILAANNPVYDMIGGVVAIYAMVLVGAAISRAATAARRCASEVSAEEGALRDELTQLPNRVAFKEELARCFARFSRHEEHFTLMCFDLDSFKNVNDSMGHETGDDVLVEAARRLRSSVRETDMVARLGGDEFALIVADIDSVEEAASIAERIVAAFAPPFESAGRSLPISVSIGVAIAPSDGMDPESLLRNADSAMYATKQNGRCGYTLFRDRFGFISERNTLDDELDRAFAENELFMAFQPFVDTETLRTTGFEALLRWRHPARGVLSAAEIVPLFERAGQIELVGAWALEEAIRIASDWPSHLRLAVNVSALQLRKPTFEKRVVDALAKSSFDPRRLELELTESALIVDGEKAFGMLASLRRMGVRTALDDLGTGYSSLANLVELPLDRLKIDRSFVMHLETNAMCASVVKLSVELARSLSLAVTAEGIENKRQLEMLRGYGCREGQGYLFSEPRPANELAPFFETCPLPVKQDCAPPAPIGQALAS